METLPSALRAEFVLGAVSKKQFPKTFDFELAFLGRSNCGKSSLLNYFLGRKALSRVSSTPGRTREINFFDVTLAKGASPFMLADLPGYGFAKAPISMVKGWRELVESYLMEKRGQKALLLMDIRRALSDEEFMILNLLEELEVPKIVVATKCDKLTSSMRLKKEREIKTALEGRAPLCLTSATKHMGRKELMELALPDPFLGEMRKYL